VLLRAGEVSGGLEVARARRAGVADRDLARGPARLAMTLALTGDQNGIDTVAPDSALVIRRAVQGPDSRLSGSPGSPGSSGTSGLPGVLRPVVRTGPRVGVSGRGGDGTAYPWRFWLEGEATVSAYRPGTARSPKPVNRPDAP
jgi:DNA-3-methyladenine glycosylase